jgi:hypothetical protein
MTTTLIESPGILSVEPNIDSNTPLTATASATAKTALWPRKRITARYRPKRTKIGRLMITTAR